MLVLTRKLGEQIVMPTLDLAITVVAIEGHKVRLGISAPSEIAVYREEIWSQIRAPSPNPAPNREVGPSRRRS